MAQDSLIRPPRRRWRYRQLVGVAVTLLAAVLVVGYLFLANVYMPLTQGSSAGPDSTAAGSLFVRSVEDPFGRGTMCGDPDRWLRHTQGRWTTMTTSA